jgi:signal transduction histidine kinase
VKREAVNLAQLASQTVGDLQVAARRANLSLTIETAQDLLPVSGDPIALRRALDNLLSNALKFTPAGGKVNVRAWQDVDSVKLQVADTGVGIPQDQLGRIFDRFYQVDGSAKRRYGGVGLGLSLVKQIVEAHGGQVTVESQVGVGTTFTIRLPNDEMHSAPGAKGQLPVLV